MAIDTLNTLKIAAKRLARKRSIKHINALEIIAVALGQPHWRGLAEAYKHGWRPTHAQMDKLPDLLSESSCAMDLSVYGDALIFTRWVPEDAKPMEADEVHGELDGQKFYLAGDKFEIAFGSQGWEITLDQAPSAKPQLKHLGGRVKSVAALDPAFIERATRLLKMRAGRMYAAVAADWPRRSTMPNREGRALHPLGRGLSAEWHCLHCDGVHGGRAMAENLWHCTDCGATPLDIFPTAFWNEAVRSA
ncbi:hypothetical protein [Agrobacterium tumefaciens]|uniref:hypothetical protein n=1 Tax=Agrobacterium tumefaciens TaxID=358 RepID=UPI0012BA31AF|nr:hypothetical protein [Agrobacterium tumefaciens]